MAIGNNINVNIRFDLLLLPYFFSLSDNTNYGGEGISSSNVKGNFEITGPSGPIHNNISWVTPDLNLATSNVFNAVSIPLVDNFPSPGTYTFKYTIQVSGGVQPGTYDKTFTINFTYQRPVVQIDYNNNPWTTTLISRDVTQYLIDGVTPTNSLVHTVKYPPAYVITDTVTTSPYIPIGSPFYVNGLYTTLIEATLGYTFSQYQVSDVITGSKTIMIADIVDIKSVFCCLDKLNSEICRLGADTAEGARKIAVFNRANALLTMMDKAVQLGQYDSASRYIEEIYEITGCTKGCTCGNTQPAIIPAVFPTPGGGGSGDGFEIGDMKPTCRTVLSSGWQFAVGQLVAIADYQDFYNVVGTAFNIGGEPVGFFRFPDTRGRVLIGAGQGTGLTNRVFGQQYGTESINATHNHGLSGLIIGNHTISPHIDNAQVENALGIYEPSGSVVLSAYEPSGTIIINQFTVTGTVTLSAYTPSGDLVINDAIVDFSNINDHTDIITEAIPGHDHDVPLLSGVEVSTVGETTVDVVPIGTYSTTPTQVSIDLSTQPLVHSGTENVPITGSFVGDLSTQTADFVADPTTATGTFVGDPSTQTATFVGDPADLEHNHIVVLNIDNHEDLVHDISGNTDNTSLILPIIQPSLAVYMAVKVAA